MSQEPNKRYSQNSHGRTDLAPRRTGAPQRVRRAADVRRTQTALTEREMRSLAVERRKDKKWEAGIQRVRQGVDRPLLVIIIILLCLGTVMVFSASYPNALTEKDDATYYIRRQLLWLAIGAVPMIVFSLFSYEVFKKGTVVFSVFSLGLLVLVLIMGTARGVARRWIYVGSVSIQPSEVAKIALVLTLAWYIDKHADGAWRNKTTQMGNLWKSFFGAKGAAKIRAAWVEYLAPGAILCIFCGLVLLEKHLSGTIILATIGLCIIFLSGANIVKMAVGYGSLGAVAIGTFLLTNEYAMQRILTHNDENADVLDEMWQTTQGLYAIGNGGPLGVGLGYSDLKHNYVSEAQNDFIFTIWCEEMGLVGAILLIVLYGLFIWRGITVARRAPDTFSSLTAFGITCQVGLQAALNMLVVTDLIPNTGIALPFFSYGGSSLVLLMAEMGILLSISKHSFQKNK